MNKSDNEEQESNSTVWFKSIRDYRAAIDGEPSSKNQSVQNLENNYGIQGSPAQHRLIQDVNKLENAKYSLLAPSGISSLALCLDALLENGDSVLLPRGVYSPTAMYCQEILSKRSISTGFYEPESLNSLSEVADETTKLIVIESPASVTFELTDIEEVVDLANERGITTLADNTWASGVLCKPLDIGVDISVISGTKYFGDYEDVFIGTVSTNNLNLFSKIQHLHMLLGLYVSPHECLAAAKGLDTIEDRIKKRGDNALKLIEYLAHLDVVTRVNNPSEQPLFSKYFTGPNGLFSVELDKDYSDDELEPFINALQVFGLAEGWGDAKSKVLLYKPEELDARPNAPKNTVLRFNSGLEPIGDQLSDLENAFNLIGA